jgi:hypothetical protein
MIDLFGNPAIVRRSVAVAPLSSPYWLGAYNRCISGYGASHLRPNLRFARTSDMRQTLGETASYKYEGG